MVYTKFKKYLIISGSIIALTSMGNLDAYAGKGWKKKFRKVGKQVEAGLKGKSASKAGQKFDEQQRQKKEAEKRLAQQRKEEEIQRTAAAAAALLNQQTEEREAAAAVRLPVANVVVEEAAGVVSKAAAHAHVGGETSLLLEGSFVKLCRDLVQAAEDPVEVGSMLGGFGLKNLRRGETPETLPEGVVRFHFGSSGLGGTPTVIFFMNNSSDGGPIARLTIQLADEERAQRQAKTAQTYIRTCQWVMPLITEHRDLFEAPAASPDRLGGLLDGLCAGAAGNILDSTLFPHNLSCDSTGNVVLSVGDDVRDDMAFLRLQWSISESLGGVATVLATTEDDVEETEKK